MHAVYVNGVRGYNVGDYIFADAIANLGLILDEDYAAYIP